MPKKTPIEAVIKVTERIKKNVSSITFKINFSTLKSVIYSFYDKISPLSIHFLTIIHLTRFKTIYNNSTSIVYNNQLTIDNYFRKNVTRPFVNEKRYTSTTPCMFQFE